METESPENAPKADRNLLTIQDIVDFADTVDLATCARSLVSRLNTTPPLPRRAARRLGRQHRQNYSRELWNRHQAACARQSRRRQRCPMSGCDLPVIINSARQPGITVSVPVIEYANELVFRRISSCAHWYSPTLLPSTRNPDWRPLRLLRCGQRRCGAGCGIAYLNGGGLEEISHTLVNSVAILSGIVCDGAKPSCAAKIASAVDAGILGWQMFMMGKQFLAARAGFQSVENTLRNISRLGRMDARNRQEIIRIMSEA
jgi:L-cysteine desulfidase